LDSSADALDYAIVVLADSDLELEAHLQPRQVELGQSVYLGARLSEGGAPVSSALAQVCAEVTAPDGSCSVVPLRESSPGSYGMHFPCPIPGVLHVRILARGRSPSGAVFQREQTLTAVVTARGHHRCRCCCPQNANSEPTGRSIKRPSALTPGAEGDVDYAHVDA
jgi:hypothetical protein